MICISSYEAAAVFGQIIPGFRPDARGRYRGAAGYRGGDNETSLAVDINAGGKYFDHALGEGGDTVAFVRRVLNCGFADACRFISDLVGRDVAGQRKPGGRRAATSQQLAEAQLFKVGFGWRLERLHELQKELSLLDEYEIDLNRIIATYTLLSRVRAWTPYQAHQFLSKWRRKNAALVESCINEATEAHLELAAALCVPPRKRSEAA